MAISISDPTESGIAALAPRRIQPLVGLVILGKTATFRVTSSGTVLHTLTNTPVHIPLVASSCTGSTSGGRFGLTLGRINVGELTRATCRGGAKHLSRLVPGVSCTVGVGSSSTVLLACFVSVVDVEFVGISSYGHGST